MVTPSRRTGPDNEAILRARLAGLPAEIWDGEGENPYFAYLGLADAILVTADSVNMVCEAASTGKPVYVIDLDGGSEIGSAACRESVCQNVWIWGVAVSLKYKSKQHTPKSS